MTSPYKSKRKGGNQNQGEPKPDEAMEPVTNVIRDENAEEQQQRMSQINPNPS